MYYIALLITIIVMTYIIVGQNDEIMKLKESIDTIHNEMKEECKFVDEVYEKSKEMMVENRDFLMSVQKKLKVDDK